MKKFRILSLLLLVVLLTGCLKPGLDIAIKPNPIIVTEETVEKGELADISVKLKMRGFSFSYTLKEMSVTLTDHEGNTPFHERIDLKNKKIPVMWPLGKSIDVDPIPLEKIDGFAYDLLKGEKWELEIVVEGTETSIGKATVEFK